MRVGARNDCFEIGFNRVLYDLSTNSVMDIIPNVKQHSKTDGRSQVQLNQFQTAYGTLSGRKEKVKVKLRGRRLIRIASLTCERNRSNKTSSHDLNTKNGERHAW